MIKARMAKEAIVRINNRMGVLAQVTKSLADMGLNIEAVIATVEGGDAIIRLVTGDHQRTVDALRDQRLAVQEARVVVAEVEHRPGLLREITEKLARQHIDLSYLYGTAAGDKCLVVFSSTNNDWAVKVLNE
ncbi:MAG TPA: ACT domain-containing protein [Candidatus Acidoferrales bacterium]|nr:ACT domain-containing protein [Candidatus Acidoferrales bacterium]